MRMFYVLHELGPTFRELRRRPGLAITAIVSLMLGIGATTAVFSVVYGLLANPYPYRAADRMIHLVLISDVNGEWWPGITGPQYQALRQTKCLESAALTWGTWNLTTTDTDLPEDVPSTQLSANAGAFFGVPAMLGRTIIPSDAPDGQDPQPVVVLSYRFWQRYFTSDPAVVGRRLQLVHKNYTIVGVLPSRFRWDDADVYLPLKMTNDSSVQYDVVARLKPGVTHEAANAELQPLLEQFARETPGHFPKKFRVRVQGMNDQFLKRVGGQLILLSAAVMLLLLVGCANVSILLLARGTARRQELAIRSAIGASRWQIQKQLLGEAVTLSLLGAAGGVVLAYRLLPLLLRWLPEYAVPHEAVFRINVPVLAFSVALAIVSGVAAGLAPALQFSRPEVAQLLQSSTRRAAGSVHGRRTHQALVAGQIALTLLLLTSAGAAINGFLILMKTSLGYDPHHVMSVGIPVHQNVHVSWEDRSHYFEQLLERVAATPDVLAAGISTNATPPSNGGHRSFEIFGRSVDESDRVLANWVSPEYFAVLRIPLLRGRLWDQPEIGRGALLAVINETMARKYWPNGDAIGKLIRLPAVKAEPPFTQAVPGSDGWMQIVGIVGDARNDGVGKPVKPSVYLPYTTQMRMWTQILVRTRAEPLALLNRVRASVKAVDPDQQVFGETRDLDRWIERQDEYAYGRLVAALFGAFATLALALAAIGLFSVVSYGVAQRTNEFGIRMALGATPGRVLRMVLGATARTVGVGLAAGAALSAASAGLLRHWAEGSVGSPGVVIIVVALLVATAGLAALIPARRAFAVDPMEALRYE